MPYKSKAQAAYFNIHRKRLEAEGVDVDEWNESTRGLKLPKHIEKKAGSFYGKPQKVIDAILRRDSEALREYQRRAVLSRFNTKGAISAPKVKPVVQEPPIAPQPTLTQPSLFDTSNLGKPVIPTSGGTVTPEEYNRIIKGAEEMKRAIKKAEDDNMVKNFGTSLALHRGIDTGATGIAPKVAGVLSSLRRLWNPNEASPIFGKAIAARARRKGLSVIEPPFSAASPVTQKNEGLLHSSNPSESLKGEEGLAKFISPDLLRKAVRSKRPPVPGQGTLAGVAQRIRNSGFVYNASSSALPKPLRGIQHNYTTDPAPKIASRILDEGFDSYYRKNNKGLGQFDPMQFETHGELSGARLNKKVETITKALPDEKKLRHYPWQAAIPGIAVGGGAGLTGAYIAEQHLGKTLKLPHILGAIGAGALAGGGIGYAVGHHIRDNYLKTPKKDKLKRVKELLVKKQEHDKSLIGKTDKEFKKINALTTGGALVSYLGNTAAGAVTMAGVRGLPNMSPKVLEELRANSGVADVTKHNTKPGPNDDNAHFMGYEGEELKGKGPHTGEVSVGRNMNKPGIVAHEYGHAHIHNNPGVTKFLQDHVYMSTGKLTQLGVLPFAGAGGAYYATKDDTNPAVGAAKGGAIGTALNAGILGPEFEASRRGAMNIMKSSLPHHLKIKNIASLIAPFLTYATATAGGPAGAGAFHAYYNRKRQLAKAKKTKTAKVNPLPARAKNKLKKVRESNESLKTAALRQGVVKRVLQELKHQAPPGLKSTRQQLGRPGTYVDPNAPERLAKRLPAESREGMLKYGPRNVINVPRLYAPNGETAKDWMAQMTIDAHPKNIQPILKTPALVSMHEHGHAATAQRMARLLEIKDKYSDVLLKHLENTGRIPRGDIARRSVKPELLSELAANRKVQRVMKPLSTPEEQGEWVQYSNRQMNNYRKNALSSVVQSDRFGGMTREEATKEMERPQGLREAISRIKKYPEFMRGTPLATLKQAADNMAPRQRSDIELLRKAKEYSDKGDYTHKNITLREVLEGNPKAFKVDSYLNRKYVGLTHRSGFKIHAPRNLVPSSIINPAITE